MEQEREVDEMTYESKVRRIEDIVQMLERDEAPFEQLAELVEEATRLIEACRTTFETTESNLSTLLESLQDSNPS